VQPEELRSKTAEDLKTSLLEVKEELFKLNLQRATGQLEKTHRLKELKHDLARTYTILKEKSKKE